jgi:two-component system sensor histidine kinase ArlS
LRRKFFLIVFAFLLVSILVVSTLQVLFFESERLRLVDQRLETIASSLIASGLSLSMIQNLESTDDLISDLLGEERVDHIINIYSLDGEVLARNYTATEIPLGFSPRDIHKSYEVDGHPVRVLNIKEGKLVIQVGVILGPSLINRLILVNSRFVLFTFLVFIILLVVAYFSSATLFRPLRNLTLELRSMSSRLEGKLGQPLSGFVVGPELKRLTRRRDTKDEFEQLCAEIEAFLRKLEGYTRAFNAQTAILTHELKTPLTVLRTYLEELKETSEGVRVSALEEIDRLSRLINDYLQWSVLSANPGQPNEIYAVKLSETVETLVNSLNLIHNGRIQYETAGETLVFALPDHVRQLVSNLLSNAVHYSDKEVFVRIGQGHLTVEDKGTGMPDVVREHLGSPFNRGEGPRGTHKSSGLGLAWVYALCNKYRWILDLQSDHNGTRITVRFEA